MKLIRFDSLWMRLNNHTDFKWFRFGKSNSKFSFVVSIISSCCCCCLVYNIFAQFNKSKLIKPDVASVSQQYASFSVKIKKKSIIMRQSMKMIVNSYCNCYQKLEQNNQGYHRNRLVYGHWQNMYLQKLQKYVYVGHANRVDVHVYNVDDCNL